MEHFGLCETSTKVQMYSMFEVLDNWNCLLNVWRMLAAFRAGTTLESGKFRELVDSKLHHQEGVRQRRQT